MKIHAKRLEVEREQDWFGHANTMPELRFPSEWEIQIVPAYSDVDIRFRVTLPSGLKKSVFLDSRCVFGSFYDETGKKIPYWEVTPYKKGKEGHCAKDNIEDLIAMIAWED